MDLEKNRFVGMATPDAELATSQGAAVNFPPKNDHLEQPQKQVTYRATELNKWNQNRLGDHQLDPVTVAFLRDPEITDRDRIAFALRELRRLGYDADPRQPDWAKPQLISSLADSELMAFGLPARSALHRRLTRIVRRADLLNGDADLLVDQTFLGLADDLYGEDALFDRDEYAFLQEPYEFSFKGDPALIEAVFQAVGFATSLGLSTPDDESETHYELKIVPPEMVLT